jgi:hypothetical protein
MSETKEYNPPTMPRRTLRALDRVDDMQDEFRQLVHEFGSEIVNDYILAGLTKPSTIRKLIVSAWNGARSAPNRPQSNKGVPGPIATLDWLLIQSGSKVNAATLVAMLHENFYAVVPLNANSAMISASMAVDLRDRVVTKHEKHHERLKAALSAGSRKLWPHLWDGKH